MSTKKIQILGGFPQADFNQTDSTKSDYIKNKPTLGTLASLDAAGKDNIPAEVAYMDATDNETVEQAGPVPVDVTAQVGQTIVVEEVDENGKPTKWKAADYQPRTHYLTETVLLPETVLETSEEDGLRTTALEGVEPFFVVGNLYKVNYNGTEYACSAIDAGGFALVGNGSIAGLSDTGEPFTMLFENDLLGVFVWDGSASVTLSVTEVVYTQIPVNYLSNALPYYVEVTATAGELATDPTTYTCADTVANVTAIYGSGRSIVARVASRDNTNGYTSYYFYHHSATLDNDDRRKIFVFVQSTQYSGGQLPALYFVPQEDGTYSVSDALGD